MNIQDEVNRKNDGSIGLPCWNSPWSCFKNNSHYITIYTYIYMYSIDLKEIAPCFFIQQFQSAAMNQGLVCQTGDFVDLLRRRMGLGWSSKQKAEAAKPTWEGGKMPTKCPPHTAPACHIWPRWSMTTLGLWCFCPSNVEDVELKPWPERWCCQAT
jgi:hypothetical protein